jgi:hypothetical protein
MLQCCGEAGVFDAKVFRVWGLGGGLGLRAKPLNMLKKEFVAQRMQ